MFNGFLFKFQGNTGTITLSSLPQSAIVTSTGSTLLIQQQSQEQPSPGTNLPLTPGIY